MKLLKNVLKWMPLLLIFAARAFAEEGTATAASLYAPIGAALTIGLAAFGGALGQGRAVASALEGMARNPEAKLFVPMLIGLAFIESLVIYALVIAFGIK